MNFKNMREVIFNKGPMNINLFNFSHKCHGLVYSKESLSPMFLVFMISILRHVFVTLVAYSWR
jgi:hypothetical protein